MAGTSYVNMDSLNDISASMKSSAGLLSSYMSEFSTAAGTVTNGWNDDENSAIFSQKISDFSSACSSLISEITKYADFMADCANNKYTPAQSDALKAMGGS